MQTTKKGSFVKLFSYEHKQFDYALPHTHTTYECVFYKDGEGTINVLDDMYKYGSGMCMVVEPNTVHDELSATDTKVSCLQFHSDFPFPTRLFPKNKQTEGILKKIENAQENILALKKDFNKNERIIEQEVQVVIINLMQLYNIHNDNKTKYQEKVIEYVKNEIKNKLHTKINFEIIAEQVGYSSDRLRKIFKQYTLESPYQYICNKRLSRAKKLLKEDTQSVRSIAKTCGFKSDIRFDLFFKERMGMSPSVYRKISNEQLPDLVYRKE